MVWPCAAAFVVLLYFVVAQALSLHDDFLYHPLPCHRPCVQGGCRMEKCGNAKCPGGACLIIDSILPTCQGDTLKRGYCNGGGCTLEGAPHPDFTEFISS
eukprot:scaffold289_cov169-Ochromonas_danica.AAC.20